MNKFKGIVFASGNGVRLGPMTTAVNKYLLPVLQVNNLVKEIQSHQAKNNRLF